MYRIRVSAKGCVYVAQSTCCWKAGPSLANSWQKWEQDQLKCHPGLFLSWHGLSWRLIVRIHYRIFPQGRLRPQISPLTFYPVSSSDLSSSSSSQGLFVPALLRKCFKCFLSSLCFPIFALWTICIRMWTICIRNMFESQVSESHPRPTNSESLRRRTRNLWVFFYFRSLLNDFYTQWSTPLLLSHGLSSHIGWIGLKWSLIMLSILSISQMAQLKNWKWSLRTQTQCRNFKHQSKMISRSILLPFSFPTRFLWWYRLVFCPPSILDLSINTCVGQGTR